MSGVPQHSPEHPVYLVVSEQLVEELLPVLRVVIDTEVPSDIEVQQEPVGAVDLEDVVGVWEGDRRLCQSCIPTRQGGPGSAPTTTQNPNPCHGSGGGSKTPIHGQDTPYL